MLPKEPQRRPQLGFIYTPPFRVQGISIAGEESVVQVPELDVCFDIGRAPRAALASKFVALTHGHMDHSAGLAYYFSQRFFQGMGVGTVLCPKALEEPIHNLMKAWIKIENQETPYNLIGMEPEEEIEVKPKHFLRAIPTVHTVPSIGYVILEKRSKLRPDLVGLSQEEIVDRKRKGEEITTTHEVPLVAYTGDTKWGQHLEREDLLKAKVLITECTFMEAGHRSRAEVGKHLHLEDIIRLVRRSEAESIILTHLSRRTHMSQARKMLENKLTSDQRQRVHLLMDTRSNRARFEKQMADAMANGETEFEPDDDTGMSAG